MQKIALLTYRFFWIFAPVLIKRYLKKRAKKAPAYLENWGERFSAAYSNPVQKPIWIHAVSVGETRAAAPLILELKKQYPQAPLLITQMTPTGRATAQSLYPEAQCRYLPYDKTKFVRQFFREHQPILGVIMETELWPNLFYQAHKQNIPLVLANARLSEKSLQGYLKIKSLIVPAIKKLSLVCAQTEQDKQRFKQLGVQNSLVCGNSKYDIQAPAAMRELAAEFKQKIGHRAVVVCASTRQKEETLLLSAWQAYKGDALLVIVPRHPERFDEVASEVKRQNFIIQKRSDQQKVNPETQVWIGDSMGELFSYYQCADVVFVGGSLVDVGGQNIIEPMSVGAPTIFGFSTYNFASICQDALKAKAAIQVQSAEEWVAQTKELLENETMRQNLKQSATTFCQAHQGASTRMVDAITATLKDKAV